jgi:hypothetical protein
MHRWRINGLLIDCTTDDIDAAAYFWVKALGRPVDPDHPWDARKLPHAQNPARRAQCSDSARGP